MAEEEEAPPEGGGKSKKKLIIIIGGVALLLIINVVAMIFIVQAMKGDEPEEGAEAMAEEPAMPVNAKPNYVSLSPPFVVNFEDQSSVRFLQVSVEVMTRDPAMVAEIELHMPRIRNALVLLFSAQNYQTLSTREGKVQIRAASLKEVQNILEERTGKPAVEEIYFTSFVMQ